MAVMKDIFIISKALEKNICTVTVEEIKEETNKDINTLHILKDYYFNKLEENNKFIILFDKITQAIYEIEEEENYSLDSLFDNPMKQIDDLIDSIGF